MRIGFCALTIASESWATRSLYVVQIRRFFLTGRCGRSCGMRGPASRPTERLAGRRPVVVAAGREGGEERGRGGVLGLRRRAAAVRGLPLGRVLGAGRVLAEEDRRLGARGDVLDGRVGAHLGGPRLRSR